MSTRPGQWPTIDEKGKTHGCWLVLDRAVGGNVRTLYGYTLRAKPPVCSICKRGRKPLLP
jgi:hypothetical protein